jgi:FecR protein
MIKRFGFALIVVLSVCFIAMTVLAGQSTDNDAVVTLIEGTARIYEKGATTGRLIKKGDTLRNEQEVRVAKKSRMEIHFPDGTVMRLSAKSIFKVNALSFNRQTNDKKVKAELSIGKLWAKVKQLMTPDSTVEVRTSNAVAGVRGTVYRVNVEDDKSTLVKVYDGSVYVANPPRNVSSPIEKITVPHEVAGPHEVPPPSHQVTMEEWTTIVKAMQQISISPQGVPSKPENFDPKADADDWVKWNQERDKETQF